MTFIIGTPHTHNAGYYRNDDTASGGKKTEADVQTCLHCQKLILMQKWKDDGGWCSRCQAPVCGHCSDRMLTYGCEPFLKQLEKFIETQHRAVSFAKLAGLDPPLIGGSAHVSVHRQSR